MKIHTIWGRIAGEEIPELIASWDEYTMDANEDGFFEALSKAKESKTYCDVRVIVLNVPGIQKAFEVPIVDATVSE